MRYCRAIQQEDWICALEALFNKKTGYVPLQCYPARRLDMCYCSAIQ